MSNPETSKSILVEVLRPVCRLNRKDLLILRDVIDILLEPSEAKKNKAEPTGCIEWKTIRDKKRGKEYGPYAYLRYWENGKLKSKYLKDYKAGEATTSQKIIQPGTQ
jgi:hypothetical protein